MRYSFDSASAVEAWSSSTASTRTCRHWLQVGRARSAPEGERSLTDADGGASTAARAVVFTFPGLMHLSDYTSLTGGANASRVWSVHRTANIRTECRKWRSIHRARKTAQLFRRFRAPCRSAAAAKSSRSWSVSRISAAPRPVTRRRRSPGSSYRRNARKHRVGSLVPRARPNGTLSSPHSASHNVCWACRIAQIAALRRRASRGRISAGASGPSGISRRTGFRRM
jgi:hypothetical protein